MRGPQSAKFGIVNPGNCKDTPRHLISYLRLLLEISQSGNWTDWILRNGETLWHAPIKLLAHLPEYWERLQDQEFPGPTLE
jgi:hypothetical protein